MECVQIPTDGPQKQEGRMEETDRKRFEEWKNEYNKKYNSPEEEEIKFSAFKENLRDVEEHLANTSLETHWKGLHEFSDMTYYQFLTEHIGIDYKNRYLSDDDSDDAYGEVESEYVLESEEDGGDEEGESESKVLAKRQRLGSHPHRV